MTAPQTPTPGVPLSAESIGYVRDYWSALCDADWHLIPEEVREGLEDRLVSAGLAEWRSVTDEDMEDSFASERGLEKGGSCLDLTPLGYLAYKADAEGWMTWSGGENPVGTADVCYRVSDDPEDVRYGFADRLDWRNPPAAPKVPIIAFRLTTPSDQGEEGASVIDPAIIATVAASTDNKIQVTTTPAPGSDGLETVAYRVRHPRHEAYRLCFVHGPLDSAEPLVTREAAEKRIGALEKLNAVLSEKLERRTVENDALQYQVAALKAALVEAHTELVACSEYLDPMIDADGDSEGFHPNREMTLQGGVNRAIERADQALALKERR